MIFWYIHVDYFKTYVCQISKIDRFWKFWFLCTIAVCLLNDIQVVYMHLLQQQLYANDFYVQFVEIYKLYVLRGIVYIGHNIWSYSYCIITKNFNMLRKVSMQELSRFGILLGYIYLHLLRILIWNTYV